MTPFVRPRAAARPALFLAALFAGQAAVSGQEKVTGANWPLARKFSREFVAQHVQEATVSPQWIGKTDQFWYQARTPNGTKFWRVDPAARSKQPLFDEAKLVPALAEAAKTPVDAATLRLSRVTVGADGKTMKFVFADFQYDFTLADGKLKKGAKASAAGFQPSPEVLARMTDDQRRQLEEMRDRLEQRRQQDQQQDQQQQQQQDQQQDQQRQDTGGTQPPANPTFGYKAYSPDKKKYIYALKHNLYLADEGKEEAAVQLTKDGVEDYSFAGGSGLRGRTRTTGEADARPPAADRKTRPNVTWSPDGKAFFVSRVDTRGVKELYLVDSIANPRPSLEKYKYPMPGEEKVRRQELYVGDTEKKAVTRVTPKWTDERLTDVRWGKTPGELRFIRRDRLQRNLAVCTLNVATGKETCAIAEAFEAAFLDNQPVRYVEETDELIWWSERSGWGHFYLYGRDGALKNPITAGPWRTSRVVDLDAKNKLLYFVGNAREPGENVYHTHLYRVKLDGTGLTVLDPGDGNHTSYLSPSKKYVVDTVSRVDQAPAAVLRDDGGNQIMELERTDLSRLYAVGWRLPETFVVKAADGVTDLFGNMWKPFDFDPTKKYPIITYVYPGPQQEGVTHRFAAWSSYMQLAQLGFVVVQVGHRGGTPERSKAYHSFGYGNLRDYGLVDKKAALEQLAARHSFLDLDRVGIYGHSGGGFMSAAAVLQKPYNDFFKAAVASAGNHDNNIYNDNWSERYHGLKEIAVTDDKKDGNTGVAATRSGASSDTGTRSGRRRPPEIEAVEAEIETLLTGLDPDDKQSVEEVEKKLVELQKRLDELKKADAGTQSSDKKADAKPPAKTKFDIKVPTNAELAANLKGHLLLVHGEIDDNVHPANTLRLADALIKANKRFDLLIIPGARHGFGPAQPYFTQKMWDFFAEHLLGDRQTKADIYEKEMKR